MTNAAHLRELLNTRRAAFKAMTECLHRPHGALSENERADLEAKAVAWKEATKAFNTAARGALPALLDELSTARTLLTEVLPCVDSGAVGHRWTGECDCAACRATALLSPDRAPAAFLES